MKVFVISSRENFDVARRLLHKIDVTIVKSTGNSIDGSIMSIVQRNIKTSAIVLALIDKTFISNPQMILEFDYALSLSEREQGERVPIVIPILLDKIDLPEKYKSLIYYQCDTDSHLSILRISNNIQRLVKSSESTKEPSNRQQQKSTYMIIVTFLIVAFNILLIGFSANDSFRGLNYTLYGFPVIEIVTIISLIMSVISLGTTYINILQKKHQDAAVYERYAYSQRLQDAIYAESNSKKAGKKGEENEVKEIDALGRMQINLEAIHEYYDWSKKQSKIAFFFAVGMCIIGFLLLTLAVIQPPFIVSGIETTIVLAIGGIATELVAGTALVVYKSSLAQLNHYHQALHEDERFLSSVNLLSRFSTSEAQDEMLRELIRSEIQMNVKAVNASEEYTGKNT